MNKEDFKNWLDRPLTETDEKIIDNLVDMIKNYDKNIEEKVFLIQKLDKIQKIIKENKEEIEVLDCE